MRMVNYKAIADAAAGYPDWQAAYLALSAELEPVSYRTLTGNDLRIWAASNAYDYETIKAASDPLSDLAMKVVDNPASVLDVDQPPIQGFIAALPITQAGKDSMLAMASQQLPTWPGLKPGHVQNAMQKRKAGKV